MGCTEISEKEEFILNLLYKNRCLAKDRAYHSHKLEKLFTKKFNGKKAKKDFEKAVQCLLNFGYITRVKKSPLKYYISDASEVIILLQKRGYRVTRGGSGPL